MSLNFPKHISQVIDTKIPTRYDDITKEIAMEKMEKLAKEYEQGMFKLPEKITYYKLGDVLGDKLDKIV